MGRPYVTFDAVLHSSLPRTFEQLGATVYWQEELALEELPLTYARQYEERMHWHYGKLIVRAAEFAARTPNLFPVFLTCFRCSPDSFLMSYVKDIVTHFGKPFLFLQLDAHASDVGFLTRIEAGLQSFRTHRAMELPAGMRRRCASRCPRAQRFARPGGHRSHPCHRHAHQPVLGGRVHPFRPPGPSPGAERLGSEHRFAPCKRR